MEEELQVEKDWEEAEGKIGKKEVCEKGRGERRKDRQPIL